MLRLWIAMLLLAAIEIPILVKHRLWGEMAVFLGLWIVATVYASVVAARTIIPSIVHLLMRVLDSTFL